MTSISDQAFQDCHNVEVRILDHEQNAVTWTLRDGEFKSVDLNGVTDVTIPSFVKCIGSDSFWGCYELTNITIGASVKRIEANAFSGRYKLQSVTIPGSVTEIGENIFLSCGALTKVTMDSGLTQIGKGMFQDCRSLANISIPNSVTNIGDNAFHGCVKLSSVEIPGSVIRIGSHAFCNCSITKVAIPENVTSVGYAAFMVSRPEALYDMTTFKDVRLVDGWAVECLSAYSGHVDLSGIRGVADKAFASCTNLTSVKISNAITNIGINAFTSCNSLAVVYVEKDDAERVRGLCAWPDNVKFVEFTEPIIEGDVSATVLGNAELGFVIKPSEDKTSVEIVLPQELDAAKVTVEVSPIVEHVTPHGAKVKIVREGNDITGFLDMPSADEGGVINLTKAIVKDTIVKEAMDPEQGAVIEMNADSPSLTTPNTRKGLVYKLREGSTLKGMQDGDSTIGDGQPWSPTITVKGGTSAFYSISVEK